jgi:hypothetical protein
MSKDELVKLLRLEGYMTYADRKEAADLIDQQAARIAELEALLVKANDAWLAMSKTATVAPAVDAQPVGYAWQNELDDLKNGKKVKCPLWAKPEEESGEVALYASAQSEGLRKLDAPAQVAGTVFRSGISWETVIKAAQRNYRYRNDPATNDYPDTFTLEQIQAMDKIIPQGDREFVGLKDYQALANEFAALSQKDPQ